MSARRLPRLMTFAALVLAFGGHAAATDYSLAAGSVRFSAPAGWPQIMEKDDGDPQFIAFQVPDPSPTGHEVLARVTVTVHTVSDAQAFKTWVDARLAKARGLPQYKSGDGGTSSSRFTYTAMENGQRLYYRESYFFKGNAGVQLRCVRPLASQAGPAWSADFDRGCTAVARSLGG
ncbi:MAG TPA: hypothetical protein VND63_09040 [Rhodanobacteraceae bacterium]|nr:hypothetical protein [Rhodanobacteraceae bacterium]